MHDVMYYLNWILDFFREGFAQVNAVLGLLIAVYFAYRMPEWSRLWAVALGAVLAHIIASILIPVIDHNAPFRLPPLLEASFLQSVIALYLGYIVAITAFFFVKQNVLASRGGKAHAH
jgi:glycopeptide antibiotics resistance protein